MSAAAFGLALVVTLLATAVPTAAWAALVWWCDRYEREPVPLAAAAFAWGAVPAVALALLAEYAVEGPGPALSQNMRLAAGIAPVAEELAKGLMLLIILLAWPRELDDTLDGILYGAMIGFGFGMTENFLYALGALGDGDWATWGSVLLLRNVVFGLNHAFFTAFAGAGLGYARMARSRPARYGAPLLGLALAIAAHTGHNLGAALAGRATPGLLISLANDAGGVLLVAVMIFLSLNQERRWLETELSGEVGQLLTSDEYQDLLTLKGRWLTLEQAQRAGGAAAFRAAGQFQLAATELAFRKHRARLRGLDQATAQDVARLAARLADARRRLGWEALGAAT